MVIPELDLGASDVPLEEDILKKKIEFLTTWLEFAADNFEQINRSVADRTVGDHILFTVPVNETLFITNTTLSAAITTFSTSISVDPRGFILLAAQGSGNHDFVADYTMPIKVLGGERVRLAVGSGHTAAASFTGFIVPKRIT